MKFYTNQYGVKTSDKLEKIMQQVREYVYDGKGSWEQKNNTKKMQNFRNRFEKEAERIEKDSKSELGYNFADVLA